jgi:hypothetical protein
VQGQRIDSCATLADGDHIRIGGHEFIFEIHSRTPTPYWVEETNEDRLSSQSARRGPNLDADLVLVTKRSSTHPSGKASGQWEWRDTGVG